MGNDKKFITDTDFSQVAEASNVWKIVVHYKDSSTVALTNRSGSLIKEQIHEFIGDLNLKYPTSDSKNDSPDGVSDEN